MELLESVLRPPGRKQPPQMSFWCPEQKNRDFLQNSAQCLLNTTEQQQATLDFVATSAKCYTSLLDVCFRSLWHVFILLVT